MNRTPDDMPRFARLLGDMNETESTLAERIADALFALFAAIAFVAIAYLLIAGMMIIPELTGEVQ